MDELYPVNKENNAEFQRTVNYGQTVITSAGAWQMYQRFNGRFDIRVGGCALIVTLSHDQLTGKAHTVSLPTTLADLSVHPKLPNAPIVIDWKVGDTRIR